MPTLLTWPAKTRRGSRGPHGRFHENQADCCDLEVIAGFSEQLTEGRMEQHGQAAGVLKSPHYRQIGIWNCDRYQEIAAALQVSPRRLQANPAAADHDILHLRAEHEGATGATMAQAVPDELQPEGAAVRAEKRGQRRVQSSCAGWLQAETTARRHLQPARARRANTPTT